MNWYVVKIIFQIVSDDESSLQFDEQLRLIDAVNQELALEMAHQMGMMKQEELKSNHQQTLKWRFVAVTEIQHVGQIEHGKEIHYCIAEPEELHPYLEKAHEKAEGLKRKKQFQF